MEAKSLHIAFRQVFGFDPDDGLIVNYAKFGNE